MRKCMCMRASEASELRKFWYFYILKLLFLSIFCRYIRCFVGTNAWHACRLTCTDKFPNVPTKVSKIHYWGGGGQLPPCPLSGYANAYLTISLRFNYSRKNCVWIFNWFYNRIWLKRKLIFGWPVGTVEYHCQVLWRRLTHARGFTGRFIFWSFSRLHINRNVFVNISIINMIALYQYQKLQAI